MQSDQPQQNTDETISSKHEKQTIDEVEQSPIELNHEIPTRTRFSGRKHFADFSDSTTQIIDTKVRCPNFT